MGKGAIMTAAMVAALAGAAHAQPKPPAQVCSRIFAPVCGTNGRTYGNACEAERAGVSISFKGGCANGNNNTNCVNTPGSGCGAPSVAPHNHVPPPS